MSPLRGVGFRVMSGVYGTSEFVCKHKKEYKKSGNNSFKDSKNKSSSYSHGDSSSNNSSNHNIQKSDIVHTVLKQS